jgi:hypothetical protein
MRSGKSRLFDVTAPVSVAYADKPLNLGGIIRRISIVELERILNIKYDENIYVDKSIQPTIQTPADRSPPVHPYSRKPLTLLAKILFCEHLITETASNYFIFIS